MVHQPGKFITLVEVEKAAAESVFYLLQELYPYSYFEPNEEIIDRYISNEKSSIILKILISEAPIQQIGDVYTPTIEKILVDIYLETKLFAPQQGMEVSNVFIEAHRKYIINRNKMFRYAARRGKKEQLMAFINSIHIPLK